MDTIARARKLQQFFLFVLIFYISIVVIYYISITLRLGPNYLPILSDEFFYYINSYSYYINKSLSAALSFNGKGSSIIGADAHGIGHPLLNGTIAKIFGWSNYLMIYTNLFYFAIGCALIILNRYLKNKYLIIVLYVTGPISLMYTFSYMQENLQWFIGLLLGVTLYNFHFKRFKIYLFIYILLIFVAIAFKPTWSFYICALFPLARSKKELLSYLGLFILGIVCGAFSVRYFIEPVPNFRNMLFGLIAKGELLEFTYLFFNHLLNNVISLLFNSNNIQSTIAKSILLGILLYFSWLYFKNKNSIILSIILVYGINIISLLTLYDAFDYRDVRFLTPLYYFSLVYIAHYWATKHSFMLSSIMVVLFFLNALKIDFDTRTQFEMKNLVQLRNDYRRKLSSKSDEVVNVRLDYVPLDKTLDLLALPVRSEYGIPIKYLVPYYTKGPQFIPNYYIEKVDKKLEIHKILN